MQFPEPVRDGGLGGAADLAPLPPAVFGVAERDLAAPQPRAVPVPFGVPAWAAMFERDSVLAAPAPGRHANSLPEVGTVETTGGDHGQARPGTRRPVQATKPQLE